jgi:ribosomal protein L30/L7E
LYLIIYLCYIIKQKKYFRIKNIPEPVSKIFKLLRLKEINSAVFLKLDKKILNKLKAIESYITYG